MKRALILAGIYWNDPLQRHQQFAKYLKQMNYKVYFVEHIISTKFTFSKLMRVLNKKESTSSNVNLDNIEIINVGFVTPGRGLFACVNNYKAKLLTKRIGTEFDLVMNYLPISTTRLILQNISYSMLIYDCVRNFEGWGGYGKDIAIEEKWLLHKCDKVFTDSFYLTSKIQKMINKPVVQFLPIANEEWRKGCIYHKDIREIHNIAYFGSVDNHIDIKCFKALAVKGYRVHIWGNVSTQKEFVHTYHGYLNNLEKLANQVTEYADAIVLPYCGNMNGVIPAKLMQCLHTGLPIFISHFYDSDILKDYLYLYASAEDLLQQIGQFDASKHEEKMQNIKCLMENLDDGHQFKKFCQEIQ